MYPDSELSVWVFVPLRGVLRKPRPALYFREDPRSLRSAKRTFSGRFEFLQKNV